MKKITKQTIYDIYMSKGKQIHFESYPKHLPVREHGEFYGRINLPFRDGIQNAGFPLPLYRDPRKGHEGKFWRSIRSQKDFDNVKKWCEGRSCYIYMASCLTSAATLGFNKPDNHNPTYTRIGKLVNKAKKRSNTEAANQLVELAMGFIGKHTPFGKCDLVAAVPATKDYDLPRVLAEEIAAKLGKKDITARLGYEGEKKELKRLSLKSYKSKSELFEAKWQFLLEAKMCYKEGIAIKGKSILLIDDLYQSGITMQYTAMVLQKYGAKEVFGLAMAKTLRNTGN